jgi:hypothetical protein
MGVNTTALSRIVAQVLPLCIALVLSSCDPVLETVPAESITISAAGNATSISTDGGTLQMSFDEIEPAASNSEIAWYVTYGTGMASVTETGLVTAQAGGTVEVFASDGTISSNKIALQIGPQTPGWKIYGPANIEDTEESEAQIALAADGTPYLAFVEGKYFEGSYIYVPTVQRFDGTAWKTLGSLDFLDPTSGTIHLSMSLSKDGTPYVAYWIPSIYGNHTDESKQYSIVVRRWNGTTWLDVGNPLSRNSVEDLTLAISLDGTVYLGYSNSTLTVLRPTDSVWQNASGIPSYNKLESMTVASDGALYLCSNNGSYRYVNKYSNGLWLQLGAWNDINYLGQVSLACDSGGIPHIAYATSLKKFVSGAWAAAGPTYPASTDFQSLAIGNDGTPYIAAAWNGNASVYKCTGTSWITIGKADFSSIKLLSRLCLRVQADGIPFVAFSKPTKRSTMNQATVMVYR